MRSDLALAALASAAVPGMKPVAVAAVVQDDETDHQQAVVEDATGRRWLVRSPLTPVAGARLRRGDDLVRQLSRHVPFKVPAPVGYAAVGQDGHAVVYPHVEGVPLDLAHLPAGPGLASALGRTVAAIHNIPRGVFEEQDLPVFDNAGCRQRLIAEVDRAAETGRVPTGLLARWEEAFDAAPLWQFVATPVHGNFRGSTVLVAFADEDAASGRVVAVTDWEEAMVADPASDLAELYASASASAWESVLDAYALARAQRPDPYLHARARLIAETRRLRGLAHAVSEQDEQVTRRIVEALRRMDRLTEDDDSLVPVTARGAGAVSTVATATTDDVPAPGAPSTSAAEATAAPEPTSAPQDDLAAPGPGRPSEIDDDTTAEVPVEAALAGLRGVAREDPEAPEAVADLPAAEVAQPDDAGFSDTDRVGTKPRDTQSGDAELGDAEPGDAEPGDTENADIEPGVESDDQLGSAVDSPPVEADDDLAGTEPTDDLADDPQERLHELYGMPTPHRDNP